MKYHNKYNKYNTLFYVFKINLLNVCVCLCIVFDKAYDSDRSEILQKKSGVWGSIWTYECQRESEAAQSCLTLCDPTDCSLSGSSVHGIFKARVLEWIAISFSRGYFWPRNRTRVSCFAGRGFTVWVPRKANI